MQYKNVLKVFGVAYMASFALARDDCLAIKKEITDYELIFPIQKCTMNKKGEVTSLQIFDVDYRVDENTLKNIFKL